MCKATPERNYAAYDHGFSGRFRSDLTEAIDKSIAEAVDDVDHWRLSYLKAEVLSKFVGRDTDSADARREAAIKKWLSVELRNSRTNQRIMLDDGTKRFFYGAKPAPCRDSFSSYDVIRCARTVIRRIIGDRPLADAEGNFSSGASTSLKRSLGNVAKKYMVQAHVTPNAWDRIWPQIYRDQIWLSLNPKLLEPGEVEGNVLFTVPKSTSIDRVAAMEPDYNMWAQKRLGDQIRRSLRRWGVNLNDQSKNQKLALEASKTRELATLDLSSASDSMTHQLVYALLPFDWYDELEAVRSKVTLIDNESHENEMFSSMGNGFTFELESLLFYAIVRSVVRLCGRDGSSTSVYGDDIICPSDCASQVMQVLGFFGFIANPKKSHYDKRDHFRESCGSHYYAGYDVKPFYVKHEVDDQPSLIHVLNSLRSWLDVEPFCYSKPGALVALWQKWSKHVDRRAWGGRDLTSRETLVSPTGGGWAWVQKRVKRSKLQDQLQNGLYLQWLRSSLDRTSPTETSLILTDQLSIYTLRRRKMSYWESVLSRSSWR